MDTIFWQQVYPARTPSSLRSRLSDPEPYVVINYGPWDRLDDNAPFVPGVGPQPPGPRSIPPI